MFDPFQSQSKPKSATAPASGSFTLRDTARERFAAVDAILSRPRSKRLVRAIRMMDLLTSGDRALHQYLTQTAQESGSCSTAPPEEGPEPDAMEVLLQAPPPPVDTVDFQKLKAELMLICRQTIVEESARTRQELEDLLGDRAEPPVVLSLCGIPGCCIHSVDLATGTIGHHYRPAELSSPLLCKADSFLHSGQPPAYVEGHKTYLLLVSGDGRTQRVNLSD